MTLSSWLLSGDGPSLSLGWGRFSPSSSAVLVSKDGGARLSFNSRKRQWQLSQERKYIGTWAVLGMFGILFQLGSRNAETGGCPGIL